METEIRIRTHILVRTYTRLFIKQHISLGYRYHACLQQSGNRSERSHCSKRDDFNQIPCQPLLSCSSLSLSLLIRPKWLYIYLFYYTSFYSHSYSSYGVVCIYSWWSLLCHVFISSWVQIRDLDKIMKQKQTNKRAAAAAAAAVSEWALVNVWHEA